jgi:hypothetical protein
MNLPLFVCEFFEANIGLPWLAEGRSLLLNQLAKNCGKVSRFLVFCIETTTVTSFSHEVGCGTLCVRSDMVLLGPWALPLAAIRPATE